MPKSSTLKFTEDLMFSNFTITAFFELLWVTAFSIIFKNTCFNSGESPIISYFFLVILNLHFIF